MAATSLTFIITHHIVLHSCWCEATIHGRLHGNHLVIVVVLGHMLEEVFEVIVPIRPRRLGDSYFTAKWQWDSTATAQNTTWVPIPWHGRRHSYRSISYRSRKPTTSARHAGGWAGTKFHQIRLGAVKIY